MLRANNQEPILIYLSEDEQLKVGNQIMLLIESRVGSFEGAINFVESQNKLADLHLDIAEQLAQITTQNSPLAIDITRNLNQLIDGVK